MSEIATKYEAMGAAAWKNVPRRTELLRLEADQVAEIGLNARETGYPERKNNKMYSVG